MTGSVGKGSLPTLTGVPAIKKGTLFGFPKKGKTFVPPQKKIKEVSDDESDHNNNDKYTNKAPIILSKKKELVKQNVKTPFVKQ